MGVVPGNIETAQQPPMTVPLRHFLVGVGFLLAGVLVGLGTAAGALAGAAALAHVHLLLVGWVCVTIMGAMTQFVPVWSGVELHSRRLSALQLWFVTVGLGGFAVCLIADRLAWLPAFGIAMLLGFWTFAYNLGRTIRRCPEYDVTERHFGLALGFFVVATALGALLALDFVVPVFASLPFGRSAVIGAHVTVAVFGAVLTTVIGALYQLATMFTQTDLHGVDVQLRRGEEIGYPFGIALLAVGRLLGVGVLARVGGVLIAASLLCVSAILARRLYETRVDWTPMLSRYAVVAAATALWAVLALPAWVADPLARDALFGAPGTVHLLAVGVVGFVVFGTLYHIVPFIIWVHRYSDLLGYEAVPMIDDLYSDRIAAIDFVALVGGTGALVVADLLGLPSVVSGLGGVLVLLGSVLFIANIVVTVREHSPHTLAGILLPVFRTDSSSQSDESTEVPDGR